MAIAPEQLPGNFGPEAGEDPYNLLNNPWSGLDVGAPEHYGEPTRPTVPGDLWPSTDEKYKKILDWCQASFFAAEAAKSELVPKWTKFYRLYRSYVEKKPGDWRSTVFIPMCFWVVETIAPRLVAQLPKFRAYPVTADDVWAAENMDVLLDNSVQRSGLYEELVKAMKSALKYGTGILKTFHRQDICYHRKTQEQFAPMQVPQQTPIVNDYGEPLLDYEGNPQFDEIVQEIGQVSLGRQSQVIPYTTYDGPAAECIDIFNFFVAPESHDIQSARYVVHRTFKPVSYIKAMVEKGVYHWPPGMSEKDLTNIRDDPALQRLMSIGQGYSSSIDPTDMPCELLEFTTDDNRVITMVNRRALLRVSQNPFDHAMKPYIRIVDYLQEHEFWGVGEIEPIEGLQDARNALTNSRIDNLRLILNAMFYVNINHVVDTKDFRMRPGGIIRGTGQLRPEDVFSRIDLGDMTPNVFAETELIDQTVEKVSGVTAMQMGQSAEYQTGTATGLAMLNEAGASRFGLKSKLIELMGLGDLGRQFASILQQFTTEEKQIRLGMTDPETGMPMFAAFEPESIQGALDITIQSESLVQSDTMRQEQKMNLLGLMAQFWPQGVEAAVEDLLDSFGEKDKERFLYGGPITQQMQQAEEEAAMMAEGGMMPPEEGGMGGMETEPPLPYSGQGDFGEENGAALMDQAGAEYAAQSGV